MGKKALDQYSLLHFASGIIAYFWGIQFWNWFYLHLAFEILENTDVGIKTINESLKMVWPGGKEYPDTYINQIGDQTSAMIGWLIAYELDIYGAKHGWYQKHIN
jgi:hypothetical protein